MRKNCMVRFNLPYDGGTDKYGFLNDQGKIVTFGADSETFDAGGVCIEEFRPMDYDLQEAIANWFEDL